MVLCNNRPNEGRRVSFRVVEFGGGIGVSASTSYYRIRTLDNKWFTFLELTSVMGITELEIIIYYLDHRSALKD